MDLSFLNKIFNQIVAFWTDLKQFQKLALLGTFGILFALIALLVGTMTSTSYIQLYSPDRMQSMDINEIKSYLDEAKIPYKVLDNKMILVPKNREHQIRMELAFYGLPKMQPTKGYDLFDNSTWIKGEKELQILELRALKGQLEHDISQYENVRSANVILDLPTQRPFGGTTSKPKASVILNLRPGTRISQSEIRAITYHLVGAVKGLTPNMVSISDTTGRLYQSIDPDGSYDSIRSAELSAEEYLKAKIDGMLATLAGYDNYYSLVQMTMSRDRVSEERKVFSGVNLGNPVIQTESGEQQIKAQDQSSLKTSQESTELSNSQQYKQMAVPVDHVKITSSPGKIEAISVAVIIDEKILQGPPGSTPQIVRSGTQLKREIENQLATILKGYDAKAFQTIDFVKFDRTPAPARTPEQVIDIKETNALTWIVALIALAVLGIFFLMFRIQQHSSKANARKAAQEGSNKKTLADLEETLDAIKSRLDAQARPSAPEKESEDSEVNQILNRADPVQLASFLSREPPQTVALLLYSLNPTRAAEILKEMPADLQSNIIYAIAHLDDLDPGSIHDLIKSTSEILGAKAIDLGLKMANTTKTAAEILKNLPTDLQRSILEKLEAEHPDLVEKMIQIIQATKGFERG